MDKKKGLFSTIWGWIGHVSRTQWVYHLLGGFVVGAVTFIKGFHASIPITYIIPLPVVAFGGTLYVINQIIIMSNRFREGYTYGLAYEGLALGFSPENQNGMLQLGVLIRNATERPLRYQVEQFDVVIEDRTIANPIFATSGGIVPRATQRRYSYPAFRRDKIETFIGKTPQGSITFAFRYGHPDGPFVRRLKMRLSISLMLASDKAGVADSILSESDDAI